MAELVLQPERAENKCMRSQDPMWVVPGRRRCTRERGRSRTGTGTKTGSGREADEGLEARRRIVEGSESKL